MDYISRSLTHPTTMLSKRSFESDTWLILGVALAIFAFLSSIGIFILCYRRRGHKRRMDKKRMTAAKTKTRGNYVQLDEEKGDSEGQEDVPLTNRAPADSPRITPPPPSERMSRLRSQSQSHSTPLTTPSPPAEIDRRRDSSPHPQRQLQPLPPVAPQVSFANISLQHPQPQEAHLPPPIVANERGRHLQGYDHDHDYDGRTGQRLDRSRSPSPRPLVLSRSISMLRPREQQ